MLAHHRRFVASPGIHRHRYGAGSLGKLATCVDLRKFVLTALLLAGLGLGTSEAWAAAGSTTAVAWTMAPLHLLIYAGALAILSSGAWTRGLSAAKPSIEQDDVLAGLSHGLRTPLNAVIGFAELMLAEVHGPLGHPKYVDYAKHVSESGTRLAEVTEQILRSKEAAVSTDLTMTR
jgi:signal transduction histidine kinase